jgi:hypothetical protein
MTDCSFVPVLFAILGAIGFASIIVCFAGLATLLWMKIWEEWE